MWSVPQLAGLRADLSPQLWDQKACWTYAVMDGGHLQLCSDTFSSTQPHGQENYLVISDTSKSKVWITFRILNTLKMLSTCPFNRRYPSGISGRSPKTEMLRIACHCANSWPAAAEPKQDCDLHMPPLHTHPPSALTCIRQQMLLRYKMVPLLTEKKPNKTHRSG